MIEWLGRRSFPVRLTQEDFDIQQSRVPRRARFLYMLSDTADAELMFARVDDALPVTHKPKCEGGTGGPCAQPDCEVCWDDEGRAAGSTVETSVNQK
jgi:hypothetical protein